MNSVNLHHAQGTWSCTGRSGHLEPYPVNMNGGTGREGIFELRPLANEAWEICGYREDKKHPDHITKVEKTLATIKEDIGMADSKEYDLKNGKYGPKGTAGYTCSPNKHAINAFIAEFCSRKKDYIKENNCLIPVIDAISLQTSSKIIKKLPKQ